MWRSPWRISKNPMMTQFPRIRDKRGMLLFSGIVLVLMVLMGPVILRRLDLSAGWTLGNILEAAVALFWYAIMIRMLGYGFAAVQTVRIEDGMILLCLGPVVCRRIDCGTIRTVGVGKPAVRLKNVQYPDLLQLYTQPLAEMEEKGAKLSQNSWESHPAARAWVRSHPHRAKVYMERTAEAEAALRRALPGAAFLV